MNFELDETEEAVRDLARQILGDATSFERTREVEADADGPGYDRALWSQLAESNLVGVAIDEAFGGQGMSFLSLALLLEEAGRALAPVPLAESIVHAALPIQAFGSDEARKTFLPPFAAGETLLVAALFETGTPFPGRRVRTRASSDGAGGYRLSGGKVCVPFAAEAEAVVVSAADDAGLGLFLVSPTAEGVRLERQQTTAHERQYVMTLDDAPVAAERVLAPPGRGEAALEWLEPRAATALAAVAVGAAEEGLRQTAEYTRARKQFGREIGSFQGVSLRAADAYIDVEAMRSTLWQAAWQIDHREDAAKAAAVAKWWACTGGHRVSHTCQHLHGGIGADIEYPIHRYFLRLKHVAMTLGGASEQLAGLGDRIAAEATAGRAVEEILS